MVEKNNRNFKEPMADTVLKVPLGASFADAFPVYIAHSATDFNGIVQITLSQSSRTRKTAMFSGSQA